MEADADLGAAGAGGARDSGLRQQWSLEAEPRKCHTQGTRPSFEAHLYYQESAAKK